MNKVMWISFSVIELDKKSVDFIINVFFAKLKENGEFKSSRWYGMLISSLPRVYKGLLSDLETIISRHSNPLRKIENMIERKDSMSIRLCRIFSTLFTSNSLYLFLIYSGDYAGFNDMWSFLNSRFFCLLDASYIESVDTFWNSLRKLYVVTSMKRGKTEEVILVAVVNE